jgi:hypothetical protein
MRTSPAAALIFLLTLGLLSGASTPARADLDHRLALLGGGGFWLNPERGGHGVILVGYDLRGWLPRGATLSAEFNTDTIRLRASRFRFWDGRLQIDAFAGYEAMLAGLLVDYYRDGIRDPSRGFNASWMELGGSAKIHHPDHHSLELSVGVRRWFFSANDSTDGALILPAEAWVLEPRLRYTYWRVQGDRAFSERHRLFPRVRGLALGIVLGFDWRSDAHPWGARGEGSWPVDTRNEPRSSSFSATQWLMAGTQLHPRIRTQLRQSAVAGAGLDDLNRVRVGGLNPYVVPVAGLPWAAYLAEQLLAVRWSWHVRFFREMEAGLLADLAVVDDHRRTGSSPSTVVTGLGLFLDLRWGDFQVDLHGGLSPPLDASRVTTHVALFADLGWQWD